MYIDPETTTTPQKRPHRSSVKPLPVAQHSLASISTDSHELVERLLQPGMMVDEVEDEERASSEERLKSFVTPIKGKAKARMPGTLITPSNTDDSVGMNSFTAPLGSVLRASPQESKPRIRQSGGPLQLAPTLPADAYLLGSQPISNYKPSQSPASSNNSATSHPPLVRSMSVEERHDYLTHLTTTARFAPASVFVLPIDEIPGEQRAAHKLGFYARAVDVADGQGLGWLIIGMEEQAVQDLYLKLTGTIHGGVKANGEGGKGLAVVGGAVAGAVITFTGLAYS